MKWGKVKVGDCCEVTSSKRIFFSEYVDSGVPFYRSKEIIESSNGQAISEPLFISQEKYDEIKNHFGVPQSGDMLLTSVGTIGVPYIVREKDYFYFKDGNLTWFRNFSDELDSKYLYFWVKSSEGQSVLNNTTIGSSQKALTIASLKGLEIPCPPAPVQKRIVEFLAGYDDLIENNQKQIKLLEEAAQRLYKEWFVDLHFPGYETTPIVDGIPQGWSKEELGNIAVLRAGGDRPKVFSKVKTVECSVPVFSNGTEDEGLYGFTNLAEIYDPCVTISARGSVGYTCLRKVAFVPIVRLISVIPKQIEVEYLFYFLKNMVFESNGAAQQQITVPMIKNKQVVLPAKTVINLFVSKIRPMMDLREKLKNKISALSEARNRLLPKLMSGEIEV